MSIESDLFDALKGLCGNRVYRNLAPEGAIRPFIVWQRVGGGAINFLDSSTLPSKRNSRIQLTVWAATGLEADDLGRQAENALRLSLTLQTKVLGSPVDTVDPETKYRGARQDFSCWG